MSEILQKQLAESLQQLADALGIAVTKIMEWGTLQVQVEIFKSILTILITIFIIVFTVKLIRYVFAKWDEMYKKDTEAPWIIACVLFFILSVIMFFCGIDTIGNLIQYVVNPEYSAFKIIIKELNSIIK